MYHMFGADSRSRDSAGWPACSLDLLAALGWRDCAKQHLLLHSLSAQPDLSLTPLASRPGCDLHVPAPWNSCQPLGGIWSPAEDASNCCC